MRPPNRSQAAKKSPTEKPTWDLESVLVFYGYHVPASSGWGKLICVHHGERKASASVSIEEGAYMCFSCGLKGDAMSIIMAFEDCNFRQAMVKYGEITGTPVEQVRTFDRQSVEVQAKSYESCSYLVSKLRNK